MNTLIQQGNYSELAVNMFIMLQKIPISNAVL